MAGLLHGLNDVVKNIDFTEEYGREENPEAIFLKMICESLKEVVDIELFNKLLKGYLNQDFRNDNVQYDSPEEPLTVLLKIADSYSSAEMGDLKSGLMDESIKSDGDIRPLASVFNRLELGKPLNTQKYYGFLPLTPENTFPVEKKEVNVHDFKKLLSDFKKDLIRFTKEVKFSDFNIAYTHLITLLQKYTWCIPCTSNEGNDISLFDHLKTTAAIVSCLYQYHSKREDFSQESISNEDIPKFQLVAGDLSGIQKYIFDISTISAGGVARRLRARSFYLAVISEVISHRILHLFDLPLCNIIIASGGNFYILLPNTEDTVDKINKLQQYLDRWFLEQFKGQININLATICFYGKEFKDFGEVLYRLSQNLSIKKNRPLFDQLVDSNGKWKEEIFVRPWHDDKGLGICHGCGKDVADAMIDDIAFCYHCRNDFNIGKLLPGSKYIIYFKKSRSQNKNNEFELFDEYSFELSSKMPHQNSGIYLVTKINEMDCTEVSDFPVNFRYMANFVPTAEEDILSEDGKHIIAKGAPLDFDFIAEKSMGRKMLGYLKADVDNLGSLFIFGLKDCGGKNLNTISRLTTLSRMLDTFFSGWVYEIIKKEFPDCYIVFSGGDDLLIIGPWDRVVDLSIKINQEFHRFTAENPNITLSAGITFSKPKIPVSVVTEQAEENLERSKEEVMPGSTKGGRNQLTAFGEVVKWMKVPYLLEHAKLMASWLLKGKLSVNFVRNLSIYNYIFKYYQKEGMSEGLKYLPLLSYDIARNLPDINDRDEDRREIRRWAEELKDIKGDKMNFLGFIVEYALNAIRR
jgi:CRISPR-associated protein Csm1